MPETSFTIQHQPNSLYTVFPTGQPSAAAVYETIEEAFDAIRAGFKPEDQSPTQPA